MQLKYNLKTTSLSFAAGHQRHQQLLYRRKNKKICNCCRGFSGCPLSADAKGTLVFKNLWLQLISFIIFSTGFIQMQLSPFRTMLFQSQQSIYREMKANSIPDILVWNQTSSYHIQGQENSTCMVIVSFDNFCTVAYNTGENIPCKAKTLLQCSSRRNNLIIFETYRKT